MVDDTSRSRFPVLGVDVDAIQIPEVILRMREWVADRSTSRFIAVTGMHGVMEAQEDASFKEVLNSADLVVPDGMPLVWIARRYGYALKRRVYGPELMTSFLSEIRGELRHFLFGATIPVIEKLRGRLTADFSTNVVGFLCPPFGPITREEDTRIVKAINASSPDVIWVGLSTPKQERWMYEHRAVLQAPVLVGVGAAFDFIAGTKKSAPRWMQEHGLEWAYRFASEPRRLWRRYLIHGGRFVLLVIIEEARTLRNRTHRRGDG